jgi:outer membrane protein assembly factor BamA
MALIAGLLSFCAAEAARAAAPPAPGETPGPGRLTYEVTEREPVRVGQIIIVGNERTKQDVILRQIPLYPGQVFHYPDLRQAERNLARSAIFEVNPDEGVRPTVTVVDNPQNPDSEFKDILVTVQEARTGSLTIGLGVNSDSGLTGSIVLNERNFDLLRWPADWEDLKSGNAFRGAGQEFRLEVVVGTCLPRVRCTFRDPAGKETVRELKKRLRECLLEWLADDEEEPATTASAPRPIMVQPTQAQTPAPAESVIVSDVIVQGNRLVSTESIRNQMKTRPGEPFVADVVHEDVRTLYKTGNFGNVWADKQEDGPGKVKVLIYVRDHPNVIKKVTFQGNRQISNSDLETVTNVRVGMRLNPVANKGACNRIVQRYNEEGRHFAACDLLKGGDPDDTEVVFNICEGPLTRVGGVSFTGNTFVTAAVLSNRIGASIIVGGSHNASRTEDAIHELTRYYRSFGFHDVKVTCVMLLSQDGRKVDVEFHIVEGVRSRTPDKPQVGGMPECPDLARAARQAASAWRPW